MPAQHSSGTPPIANDAYRLMVSNAPIAAAAIDAQFKIFCWNDAAGKLLGVSPDEILGKSIYELVPANRHKLLGKLLQRTMRGGEVTQLEVRIPSQADQIKNLVFMLSPIADAQSSVQGVAVWILDETHRTQLSRQLAQTERLASLGTLAGGVAHHFNNIIGGVATYVDYALSSGSVIDMKRALQLTSEAAARASKLTQSLLSFAKKDTHRTDMADLTEIVLTFVHMVERPLSEQNLELQLDIKAVPIVPIEANRMHQVLGNLLTNAKEAMPQGGTIRLAIDCDEKDIILSFADTGCGIDPKHLPLVFEPFFTTKGLLAGGDQGNPGLGLSVVHGIVTDMGGRIDVESKESGGTRFIIRFPIPPRDQKQS